MRLAASVAVLSTLLASCGKPAEPSPSTSPPATSAAAARTNKLAWADPPTWTRSPPSNPTRLAQYAVPRAGEDTEAPECVVTTFGAGQGGPVDANIDRWIRQFEPSSASSVEKQTRQIGGLAVTIVELSGAWRGMAMPGAPPPASRPGQRMLAAIVEHPSGAHFFKLVGPDTSVKDAKPAFVAMLESLR